MQGVQNGTCVVDGAGFLPECRDENAGLWRVGRGLERDSSLSGWKEGYNVAGGAISDAQNRSWPRHAIGQTATK